MKYYIENDVVEGVVAHLSNGTIAFVAPFPPSANPPLFFRWDLRSVTSRAAAIRMHGRSARLLRQVGAGWFLSEEGMMAVLVKLNE